MQTDKIGLLVALLGCIGVFTSSRSLGELQLKIQQVEVVAALAFSTIMMVGGFLVFFTM